MALLRWVAGQYDVHNFYLRVQVGELEEIIMAMANVPEDALRSMRLVHEGKILGEKGKSLYSCNVQDNDLLAVVMDETSSDDRTARQRPSPDDGADIERVRQHIIGDPAVQAQLRQVVISRRCQCCSQGSPIEAARVGDSRPGGSGRICATNEKVPFADHGTRA